jgi:hypothetical protein
MRECFSSQAKFRISIRVPNFSLLLSSSTKHGIKTQKKVLAVWLVIWHDSSVSILTGWGLPRFNFSYGHFTSRSMAAGGSEIKLCVGDVIALWVQGTHALAIFAGKNMWANAPKGEQLFVRWLSDADVRMLSSHHARARKRQGTPIALQKAGMYTLAGGDWVPTNTVICTVEMKPVRLLFPVPHALATP